MSWLTGMPTLHAQRRAACTLRGTSVPRRGPGGSSRLATHLSCGFAAAVTRTARPSPGGLPGRLGCRAGPPAGPAGDGLGGADEGIPQVLVHGLLGNAERTADPDCLKLP